MVEDDVMSQNWVGLVKFARSRTVGKMGRRPQDGKKVAKGGNKLLRLVRILLSR